MIIRVNENEEDRIIGLEGEWRAKTRLFMMEDVKECVWEEPYLEVMDPHPLGCLCSPCLWTRHRVRPQKHNA